MQGELEILYACDEERDVNYAKKAGNDHGLEVVAGKPGMIAEHIVSKARNAALVAEQ